MELGFLRLAFESFRRRWYPYPALLEIMDFAGVILHRSEAFSHKKKVRNVLA
jgi:hypothetical protein